jgi:hypothetical protein
MLSWFGKDPRADRDQDDDYCAAIDSDPDLLDRELYEFAQEYKLDYRVLRKLYKSIDQSKLPPKTSKWFALEHCIWKYEQFSKSMTAVITMLQNDGVETVFLRVTAATYVADKRNPIFNLEGLATIIWWFIFALKNRYRSITRTGHAVYPEIRHRELDALGRTYYTRVPQLVKGLRIDLKHDYDYTIEDNYYIDPYVMWDDRIFIRYFTYDWKGNDYEKSPIIRGLNEADAAKLESVREKFIQIKFDILMILVDALLMNEPFNIIKDCVAELVRVIPTEDELEFYYKMDRFYNEESYIFDKSKKQVKQWLISGGLSDLIFFIGECEKELTIGTFCKTEGLIRQFINPIGFNVMRLQSDNYFELLSLYPDKKGVLDAALDTFNSGIFKEYDYWPDFYERINREIKAAITVKAPDSTSVDAFINYLIKHHAEKFPSGAKLTLDFPGKDKSKPVVVKDIQKFPFTPDLKWSEVVIIFTSDEDITVCARGISKKYHFDQIGFVNETTRKPNVLWELLFTMAIFNGRIDFKSGHSVGVKNPNVVPGFPEPDTDTSYQQSIKLDATVGKKRFSDLRNALKDFMQINDDPFKDYNEVGGYETVFQLSYEPK